MKTQSSKVVRSALSAALCCCSLAFGQTGRLLISPPLTLEPPSDLVTAGPLGWKLLGDQIYAVPGSDGLYHLAYSLVFTNEFYLPVTIQSIEVLDPDKNLQPTGKYQVLNIQNEDITGQVRQFSLPLTLDDANFSAQLGPGQAGMMYFDVTYPSRGAVPEHVSHRVSTSVPGSGGQTVNFVVVDDPVTVSQRDPIVLSPPLRGNGWVNANGCCKQIGPHRGAFNPINGVFWQAETFAIDFVAVNGKGVGFSGDGSQVSQYFYYGAEILAAKGGKVIEMVNDMPDQIPNQDPGPTTIQTAAGNHVVVDMGDGQYALYAHLKPYSVTVQVGDMVIEGQLLGLLGNSGNTTAPHLHFQVMDGPIPLKANGLPFVFNRFTLAGTVADSVEGTGEKFSQAIPLPILDRRAPQRHKLPLMLDVLNFR